MNNLRPVLGVGLPKTGTTSLKRALRLLGYPRVWGHNPAYCERYFAGDFDCLLKAFGEYRAAQDLPWALIYQLVYREFPDTLFVLTKRKTEDAWFDSLCAHAARKELLNRDYGVRERVFGYRKPDDNKGHHIDIYRKHIETVRDFFADKGTLIEVSWDDGDAWGALCSALGLPLPNAPFPHANKKPA